jgi:hypothetical protein
VPAAMPPPEKKEHPCPRNLVCGHVFLLTDVQKRGIAVTVKSKKKIMFFEYLSNLSNAGALREPALL